MEEIFAKIKIDGPSESDKKTTIDILQNLSKTKNTAEKMNLMDKLPFRRREQFIKNYSYAVPEEKAIDELAKFISTDTCLEVGAGSGLWSYLLRSKGIKMIATDAQYSSFEMEKWEKYYINVEKLDGESAIKKYANCNVLMMCWSRIDFDKNFKGSKYIYIGENEGQSTCGIPDDEWIIEKIVKIPTWDGIIDHIRLYRRKA